MKASPRVDRRTFLKMGATGAALAASNPASLGTQTDRQKSLRCPPSLQDLASDRLTHHFRDLFNCPATMNELGYAQVGKSVSSMTAIACPPYVCCGAPETAWSPASCLPARCF